MKKAWSAAGRCSPSPPILQGARHPCLHCFATRARQHRYDSPALEGHDLDETGSWRSDAGHGDPVADPAHFVELVTTLNPIPLSLLTVVLRPSLTVQIPAAHQHSHHGWMAAPPATKVRGICASRSVARCERHPINRRASSRAKDCLDRPLPCEPQWAAPNCRRSQYFQSVSSSATVQFVDWENYRTRQVIEDRTGVVCLLEN